MTEFTNPQNLDPAQQERLAQWRAIDAELNRSSEYWYGHGLDEGINDATVGVNAVLGGYYTRMSCEGHDDHGYGSPWIGFDLAGRESAPEHLAQLDGLMQLIDEFNDSRTTGRDVRIGIYTGMGGDKSGMYELTTAAAAAAAKSEDFVVGRKSFEEIEAEQQEFADFAVFLKQKFIDGFSLEAPEVVDTPDDSWEDDGSLARDIENSRLFAVRDEVLKDFAERPGDNDIWETAYDLVRSEGDMVDADEEPLTADDIPADALIAFAEKSAQHAGA